LALDGASDRHHGQPLYPWERSMVPTENEIGWAPEPVYMIWRREFVPVLKLYIFWACFQII